MEGVFSDVLVIESENSPKSLIQEFNQFVIFDNI